VFDVIWYQWFKVS